MSINKRAVLYDFEGGVYKFSDWALVDTTLGAMAEPFLPNDRHLPGRFGEFDPLDEISKINELMCVSSDVQSIALSGGNHALHGGQQLPRDGR